MEIKVGTPATLHSWSDRSPAYVSRISSSGKTVWIQLAQWKRTDSNGLSEIQEYDITPDPNGAEYECLRSRKEIHKGKDVWVSSGGRYVTFGHADVHRDPHF